MTLPNQNDEIRPPTFGGRRPLRYIWPAASEHHPLSSLDRRRQAQSSIARARVPMPEAQQGRAAASIIDAGFGEWGTVVKTWFVADPKQCYVKFKSRATAQLVIEALHGRPLRPEDGAARTRVVYGRSVDRTGAAGTRRLAYNERCERRGSAEEQRRSSTNGSSERSAIVRAASRKRRASASNGRGVGRWLRASSYSEWVHESGGEPVRADRHCLQTPWSRSRCFGEEPAASTTSLPPGWQAASIRLTM